MVLAIWLTEVLELHLASNKWSKVQYMYIPTCSCERSMPTLRRLKTYLRNSLSETHVNGLAMLNVHREIELDVDEVIGHIA